MQARLYAHTSAEIARAQEDSTYYNILTTDDLAAGDDVLFVATGVSDGELLRGVRFLSDNKVSTETVIMRSASGTLRFIRAIHDMNKKPAYGIV